MMNLNVITDVYEGPLDLLLELVEKNKIDIYDIPISLLADQYLEAISLFTHRDMNSMSEFILTGAHLLEIKSRMLLPRKEKELPDDETDPRRELAERLAEYRRFKQAAAMLRELGEYGGMEYYKGAETGAAAFLQPDRGAVISAVLGGVTVAALYKAFLDTLARRELSVDRVRGGFGSITKDTYTVSEKIFWIKALLKEKKQVVFSGLFSETAGKAEIIVTFLALLELLKQNVLSVTQNEEFGEISITVGG
jgi:segregation and condensation protein A